MGGPIAFRGFRHERGILSPPQETSCNVIKIVAHVCIYIYILAFLMPICDVKSCAKYRNIFFILFTLFLILNFFVRSLSM